MGGYGSGVKFDKQSTLENLKKLDVRLLKKKGALKTNSAGTLSWTVGGQPDGAIRFRMTDADIRLNFNYRDSAYNDWVAVEQIVGLEKTPCHFGGERTWFTCPDCRRRVGVLCLADKTFACRRCNGVAYRSNNAGKLDRLINQKHKLGEKTFEGYENGFDWTKKKHMRQRVFDKLSARYYRMDDQIDAAIASMTAGL